MTEIESAVAASGGNVSFFDETVSTNTVLCGMGREGAREGTTVVADTQTGGRGRMGRSWVSPRGGNLFISFLFRPHLKLSLCPASTFMASLALCDTFRAFGVVPEIKWPNDILTDGRKIAGVLSEAEAEGEFCKFIVIGIGVNLNLSVSHARELMEGFSDRVTSVSEVLGSRVDRGRFTGLLIKNLFARRDDFVSKGYDWTVARWAVEWGKLNNTVKINNNGSQVEGIARKLDGRGFLYIETSDGSLVRVVSGDTL